MSEEWSHVLAWDLFVGRRGAQVQCFVRWFKRGWVYLDGQKRGIFASHSAPFEHRKRCFERWIEVQKVRISRLHKA